MDIGPQNLREREGERQARAVFTSLDVADCLVVDVCPVRQLCPAESSRFANFL